MKKAVMLKNLEMSDKFYDLLSICHAQMSQNLRTRRGPRRSSSEADMKWELGNDECKDHLIKKISFVKRVIKGKSLYY